MIAEVESDLEAFEPVFKVTEKHDVLFKQAHSLDGTWENWRAHLFLSMPIKTRKFPLYSDGGQFEEDSKEAKLSIENFWDCLFMKEDHHVRMQGYKQGIFSDSVVTSEQIDHEYETLCYRLAMVDFPRVFRKHKLAISMPIIVMFMVYMYALNLVHGWILSMFEPECCRLSPFELLKSGVGIHGIFHLPCG